MFDPEKFGEAMGAAIREAVAPLLKRIDELEGQIAKAIDLSAEVERAVAIAVAALPAPKDGQDVDMAALKQMVASEVAALPAAAPGKPGEPGKSVTLEDVSPLIREAVKTIRDDVFEQVEAAVKAIPEPKSGVGVTGAMIDRDGNLQLTLSNGEMKCLGVVVGKDGADFTDASFEYDGERSFVITGKGGSITKRLPIPMDRGYYRDGMPPIEKGDIVTHDGNAWIALKDTRERPSHEAKDDWRLFARKGRDGERGAKGIDGSPPAPIKLGA